MGQILHGNVETSRSRRRDISLSVVRIVRELDPIAKRATSIAVGPDW